MFDFLRLLGVSPLMGNQEDFARQAQSQASAAASAAGLGALSNMATAAPRPPTNIEEAIQKCHRLIENHAGLLTRNAQLIDRINGPRPETEQRGQEVGGASGQLSELHRLLDIIDDQTKQLANQIDTLDGTI